MADVVHCDSPEGGTLSTEESNEFIREVMEHFKGETILSFGADESGDMVAEEVDAEEALASFMK